MEKEYVLIRTDRAGVHFGTLEKKEYTPAGIIVTLKNAKRVYYWEGACSLSELATMGTTKPNDCKFAIPVKEIELKAIEVILMTETAVKNLNSVELWINHSIEQILETVNRF